MACYLVTLLDLLPGVIVGNHIAESILGFVLSSRCHIPGRHLTTRQQTVFLIWAMKKMMTKVAKRPQNKSDGVQTSDAFWRSARVRLLNDVVHVPDAILFKFHFSRIELE